MPQQTQLEVKSGIKMLKETFLKKQLQSIGKLNHDKSFVSNELEA